MFRRIAFALSLAWIGFAAVPLTAAAVTVSVDPADTNLTVGEEFVVRFVTDTIPDLKAFKLLFPFDPSRLLLLSAVEGEVLTSAGGAYVTFLNPDVTAPADTFEYDAAMLEGSSQGPGVLVYATFKAIAPGDAAISCASVDFRDSGNTQTSPPCSGTIVHIAHAGAVSIDPPDSVITLGDEFVARFVIDSIPDLAGFELLFPYDPTRLQLLSAVEGDVVTAPGQPYVAFLNPDVSAPADTFSYDAAILGGSSQGPGVLVYATFRAIGTGDALIDCGSADFRNSNNDPKVPLCSGAVLRISSPPVPGVRISQVYGGGGNSGALYTHDFVELFNSNAVPVDVTGWSVQYGPANGASWQPTVLSGTIPAGGYYLVQQAAGGGGTVSLPAPDAVGVTNMSRTSGKVALVTNSTALAQQCPADTSITDLVGYGSSSCFETAPTAALDDTAAALRNFGGCVDTDDNSADFTLGAPTPRNSASPPNVCDFALTVAVNPVASGTVTISPDLTSYTIGSVVELTAEPDTGWFFLSWSGDASGSQNPLTVVMDSDRNIIANFTDGAISHPIVISQVYGGGGDPAATYRNDYVELFNRGPEPIDLTGWSVQYASDSGSTWLVTTLSGTIQPAHHYLVQQAAGGGGTVDLATPDAIGTTDLSATDGKVAVVNNSSPLTGNCPAAGGIEDFVGYGTADCSEGSPISSLDDVTAAHRGLGGCLDTDDNLADFVLSVPDPRNSAGPANVCSYLVDVPTTLASSALSLAIHPNPSRGTMRMHFALPGHARTQLDVFDLQGRIVATLVDGDLPAGRHTVHWSGLTRSGVALSGIYFVRLQMPGQSLKRTIVIAR